MWGPVGNQIMTMMMRCLLFGLFMPRTPWLATGFTICMTALTFPRTTFTLLRLYSESLA